MASAIAPWRTPGWSGVLDPLDTSSPQALALTEPAASWGAPLQTRRAKQSIN